MLLYIVLRVLNIIIVVLRMLNILLYSVESATYCVESAIHSVGEQRVSGKGALCAKHAWCEGWLRLGRESNMLHTVVSRESRHILPRHVHRDV